MWKSILPGAVFLIQGSAAAFVDFIFALCVVLSSGACAGIERLS